MYFDLKWKTGFIVNFIVSSFSLYKVTFVNSGNPRSFKSVERKMYSFVASVRLKYSASIEKKL